MRESIHKQGQILEIIHNPHMDYDERLSAIREIVGAEPRPMTRRIVQISADPTGTDVLCDDGSLWFLGQSNKWQRRPDIPQDEPVEADPIAELEAMGGRLLHVGGNALRLVAGSNRQEFIGMDPTLSDLRAAAARLLARVRGASDAS